MNKKKIFVISISAAVLLFVIPLTVFAYLRSVPEETENKVEILKVEQTVTETFIEPETQQREENTFQKEVYVENTGSVPCFVRVYMDFSDSIIKEKSQLSADGMSFYNWNEFLNHPGSNWTYISTEANEPEALKGWFYYTEALPVKDKNDPENKSHITTALLKALKIDYQNNYYAISDFQLIVYSETVQAVDENGEIIQDQKENDAIIVPAWKVAWKNFINR